MNYTLSKGLTNMRVDSQSQDLDFTTRRNLSLDRAPSAFDIHQVFQVFGTYDLPIGKGARLPSTNARVDRSCALSATTAAK
ncbi:MAG TPA: hypothetical protein VGP79_12875 [Bryobacteraceae bacterium]|nr:hypothetical protein [Bryobacteraceae bacterium]